MAVDPASQTIETQHIDGEVNEYDMDSWAELLLVGRLLLDIEVTEHRRMHHHVDALDLILRVDRCVHAVLAEHRDRHDMHFR